MLSKISVSLFFVFTLMCSSAKKNITPNFKNNIHEVYFERWVAGVRGGGSGINFHVFLDNSLSENALLQKVQFENQEAVFQKINDLHYVAYLRTNGNDLEMHETSDKEYGNEVPVLDFNLKPKQAKIFIAQNGNVTSFLIDNVKEKEMIAYPSMNKPRN